MPMNLAGRETGESRIEKTPALLEIARRLIWWLPPEEALEFPTRFLAQVMTLATWDDVQCVRAQLGAESFRDVLRDPPPGVFDERSWHYWHHVFGIGPVPPLPQRKFRDGQVKVSFFGGLTLGRVGQPERAPDNSLLVAGKLDLAATKARVVIERAERKDYLDMAALLRSGIQLSDALGAARALYGDSFNPMITLKALTYFADGDLPQLPADVKDFLVQQASQVTSIPQIRRISDRIDL